MKTIALSQGKVALVSDEDYETLSQFNWYAYKDLRTYYAQRQVSAPDGQRTVIRMHHAICGKGADHINGDGLDNRRENLRRCTHQQNTFNTRSRNDSTSHYKGVSWKMEASKWVAQIQVNGKKKHLGYFVNEDDAARAYDDAALRYFGEFAHLNNVDGAQQLQESGRRSRWQAD